MTSRFAARALLAALCLAASSCVFNLGNGNRGNVTFRWTFGNQVTGCAGAVGVSKVVVEIPGQALAGNGVYSCTDSGGTDGIQLLDFAPGDYTYTVSAEDSAGTVLYQAVGSFVVDGSITVPVVLNPGAGTPGGLLLSWTLPPTAGSGGAASTCAQLAAQVGIAPADLQVQVAFDSGTAQSFACTAGQGAAPLSLIGLTPGSHTLDVSARNGSGFFYVRKGVTVTIFAGAFSDQTLGLDWIVGSLPLQWSFSSGGSQKTCAQAGVTKVLVNLRQQGSSTWLYGGGFEQPCTSAGGVQGTLFPFLYSGSYQVNFQAFGTNNVLYQSDTVTLPTASVTAGQFPVLGTGSQTILLTYP